MLGSEKLMLFLGKADAFSFEKLTGKWKIKAGFYLSFSYQLFAGKVGEWKKLPAFLRNA